VGTNEDTAACGRCSPTEPELATESAASWGKEADAATSGATFRTGRPLADLPELSDKVDAEGVILVGSR